MYLIGGSMEGTREAQPPPPQGGRQGLTWGPNSFIFMQFSAKKMENNRLAHPLWELAPPQENPGTATVSNTLLCGFPTVQN